MKIFIIIAIMAYTGSDTTECRVINLKTKDTGTMWIVEGCFEKGDTIIMYK